MRRWRLPSGACSDAAAGARHAGLSGLEQPGGPSGIKRWAQLTLPTKSEYSFQLELPVRLGHI